LLAIAALNAVCCGKGVRIAERVSESSECCGH